MFGKKKQQANIGKKIQLYVPDSQNTDKYSNWRKPDTYFRDSPLTKQHQLALFRKLVNAFSVLNMILCGFTILIAVMLIFFTQFEHAVLDDGTYLNCFIDSQGKVLPLVKTK